jgi:hypothetical protein
MPVSGARPQDERVTPAALEDSVARSFLRLALLCALAATCGFAASSAKADLLPGLTTGLLGGSCGSTTTPFAQFGDSHAYYFTGNGGFESGSTGWTLGGGAKIVAGNESFYAHSATDKYSLLLPSGSKATSSPQCFGLTVGGIRFFARSPSGTGSVHVRVFTKSLLSVLSILDGGTVTLGTNWAPSNRIGTLGSQLAILTGSKSVQIELTTKGDVQIDDVYIDPYFQES